MLKFGNFNTLKIASITSEGAFFECDEQSIFLAAKEVNDEMKIGDELAVFVYMGDQSKIMATLKKPIVVANQVGFLTVNDVNKAGAFADMGIEKELLIPYYEQEYTLVAARNYIVYVFIDTENNRLCGSTKLAKFIDQQECDLHDGDEVNLMITKYTDLGYNAIVNNLFSGLLYRNEVFRKLSVGEQIKGYIKKVREDGKLDISLQKTGIHLAKDAHEIILNKLKENNGTLNISDNSTPREIAQVLQMSKKTFKKAIGNLYKDKKIKLLENGIELV